MLSRFQSARVVLRRAATKEAENDIAKAYKEDLRLARFGLMYKRKLVSDMSKTPKVTLTQRFRNYFGFEVVPKGYKPTRSGRAQLELSPTPTYKLRTSLIHLQSAMFRTVLLCILPTFCVVFVHSCPGYNLEDMLMRPHNRKVERLEYQISYLKEREEQQLIEIEQIKIEKNINLDLTSSREVEMIDDVVEDVVD